MIDNALLEKWKPILESKSTRKEPSLNEKLSVILENQEQYVLTEAAAVADMAQYTPILVPAVRRILPNLLANEIVSVQPMSLPTGYAYALRYSYEKGATGTGGADRGPAIGGQSDYTRTYQNAEPTWTSVAIICQYVSGGTNVPPVSGNSITTTGVTGTVAYVEGSDLGGVSRILVTGTVNGFRVGDTLTEGSKVYTALVVLGNEAGFGLVFKYYSGPVTTGTGETMGAAGGAEFKSMKMGIERSTIEAMTRKLKAEYTHELAQDLKAVHGLDAEAELINILEYEVGAELDRELVEAMRANSTSTATWYYNDGSTQQGNVVAADGRWEQEKFRTLYSRIVREANMIALTTRRGAGNFIVCSTNVVSALETLNNFMYASVPGDVKPALGVAKVGTLDGRFNVYLDTFAWNDFVLVGYKGASAYDSGIIYCPYVPLVIQKVQDPNTFQPKIAVMTRDAIATNMFGTKNYYRQFTVNFAGSQFIGGTYSFNSNF